MKANSQKQEADGENDTATADHATRNNIKNESATNGFPCNLRQYYAAKAMQALLNDAWYKSRMLNEGHTAKKISPDLAQDAFTIADAMIEAEDD